MDPQGKSKQSKWKTFLYSSAASITSIFKLKMVSPTTERGRRPSWVGRDRRRLKQTLIDLVLHQITCGRFYLLLVAGLVMIPLLQVTLSLMLRGGTNLGPKHHHHNSNKISLPKNFVHSLNEEVTCVAWRATANCDPDGPLLSQSSRSYVADTDLSCDAYVPSFGTSGYCELVTKSTGRTIQAFRKPCDQGSNLPYPLWKHFVPTFRCDQAVDFMNYQHAVREYKPKKELPMTTPQEPPKRGILLQIYPSCLPSVYTILKLLRHVHHCQLPVELWHLEGEVRDTDPMIKHLVETFDHITLRTITDMAAASNSYMSKPYAIAYSHFDQVLFLDSDNFPFTDPTFLFDTPEFQANSAMFWKDFWNPRRRDFIMSYDSLVWELLGIPTNTNTNDNTQQHAPNLDMELESGQMVIDRRKSVAALHVVLFLAKTFGDWFDPLLLVWGDKDLWRLAYYVSKTPFHYIKEPPGLAGRDVVLKWASYDKVCGITMVQHSPQGEPLFFHRNIAKISTESDLFKVWQKGVKFVGSNPDTEYAVEGTRSYYRLHGCYHPTVPARGYFKELDYRGSKVEEFEETILRFAKEGMDIMRKR